MDTGRQSVPPWGAFAIKDCALVAIATGRRARNLLELRDELRTIDPASVYFHFWGGLLRPTFDDPRFHNGFAIWADHALHDTALAGMAAFFESLPIQDWDNFLAPVGSGATLAVIVGGLL